MKKIYTYLLAATCTLSLHSLTAQCSLSLSAPTTTICTGDTAHLTAFATNATPLTTTSAAGNNHRGNMFDISATNGVIINSFDVSPMGNTTIEIYYRTSPYAGFESSSAGWIFVGSAPVQYTGSFVPVAVPVNVSIPAGQTYAFYVTSSNTAVSLNYTDGSAEGATFVSDANLNFLQGVGLEYPFTNGSGSVFRPRVWNGVIHYTPLASPPTITYLWSTTETTASIDPIVGATMQFMVQADVTGCATMYDTILVTTVTPSVTAGADISICPGTSVTLAGSGAVSYTWNHGVADGVAFAPDSTRSYIVTGTDAIGCMANDTVMVTLYSLPAVSAGADLSICTGDTITLSATGATSYVWDNGVNDGVAFVPTGTMNYIVEGTDANSCTNKDTITVTVNSYPVVNAGSDVTVCQGATVTLSGSGATTYTWNNGVSDGVAFVPSASADFIVSGTTNGCIDSDTVMVTVNNVNTNFSVTGAVAAAAASGAVYQWMDCNTSQLLSGETSQSFTAGVSGSYAVIVTENSCTDTSTCQTITVVGIRSVTQGDGFSIYPNPTSGQLNLNTYDVVANEIAVLDLSGRVIGTVKPLGSQISLDMSGYASGTYLVRIVLGDKVRTIKLTRE